MYDNLGAILLVVIGFIAFGSAIRSLLIQIAPKKHPKEDGKAHIVTILLIGAHQAIWHLYPWS